MAMDSLQGEHDHDTLVVIARDGAGAIRGVLHFVPCYGRPAVSLSFMRRDPETPNGLTEFLVVRAIELLRDRGLRGALAELRRVRQVDAQPGHGATSACSGS